MRRVAPAVIGSLGELFTHPERLPITRFNAEVSPHRVFETRRFTLDEFKRIRSLEEMATSFEGVQQAFAIQAGREVRVIVRPEKIDDLTSARLARDVGPHALGQAAFEGAHALASRGSQSLKTGW